MGPCAKPRPGPVTCSARPAGQPGAILAWRLANHVERAPERALLSAQVRRPATPRQCRLLLDFGFFRDSAVAGGLGAQSGIERRMN